jgi:hypothetical protein
LNSRREVETLKGVPDRLLTAVDIEPTSQDLDAVMRDLQKSWTSTLTVRRTSKEDVGYREIFILLDGQSLGYLAHGDEMTREIPPGHHRLKAHNTLFSKTVEFTVGVGDHASFIAINKPGWGTYSVWAFFLGFLGAGPFYLTFERESLV